MADIEKFFLDESYKGETVDKERAYDSGSDGESTIGSSSDGLTPSAGEDLEVSTTLDTILRDQERRHQLDLGGPNTGIKGVLADYRFHQWMQKKRDEKANNDLLQDMKRFALTRKDDADDDRSDDETLGPSEKSEWKQKGEWDELEEIRQKRLDQLIRNQKRPKFGSYKQVSCKEYVEAIENENPSVTVIVHLYEKHESNCLRMHKVLGELARKYSLVKFIALHAREADQDFDCIGLPTLLVYKGGELQCNLTNIMESIKEIASSGVNFEAEDVEVVLERKFVLKESDRCEVFSI